MIMQTGRKGIVVTTMMKLTKQKEVHLPMQKFVATLKDDTNADESDSSDLSDVVVLDDYIFPAYMMFRLWGPFAPPEDRLLLFENNDAPKNAAALSRAAKCK